jgi:hypothetical protein
MDGLEDEPYILSSIDGEVFYESINKDSDPNEVLKEAFNKHLAKKYKKELDLDGDGIVSDDELSVR